MSELRLKTRKHLRAERDNYKEQLVSLFERISGCDISEFDKSQLPYLADMIEGQLDASEGCIDKLTERVKELEGGINAICSILDTKHYTNYEKTHRIEKLLMVHFGIELEKE